MTTPLGHRIIPASRRSVLEFVDEAVDREVDTDAVHDAVAALLLRWWRSNYAPGAENQ